MCGLLIFYGFCMLEVISGDQLSLYQNEIRSLSELPMDKLIQIKTCLASENGKIYQFDLLTIHFSINNNQHKHQSIILIRQYFI